jgi:hypothetical protein
MGCNDAKARGSGTSSNLRLRNLMLEEAEALNIG